MDCRGVRERLMGIGARPLGADEQVVVSAHLDECEDCRRAVQVDQALSRAVGLLPRQPASADLRKRIEAQLMASAARPSAASQPPTTAAVVPPVPQMSPTAADDRLVGDGRRPSRSRRGAMPAWSAALLGACVATVLVLAVVARSGGGTGGSNQGPGPSTGAVPDLVREAVNDHLRVVNSVRPVEIESGGIHQVKPWFTGRVEFAPRVAFSGDGDFALLGGSVGYFHDRRAAVFSFKRRLHTITLLVVPYAGLPWPDEHPKAVGVLSVTEQTSRGFSLLFWRAGDLGYVLVSDINRAELEELATRLDRE